MRKLIYFLIIVSLLTVTACSSGNDEQEETNKKQAGNKATETANILSEDLTNELDQVLSSLEELKNVPADNTEKIQKAGKELEENWDRIEKQIEENYPKDYTNIENSLYPLIDEAKKDMPNKEKISKLVDDTTQKIKTFKQKIGGTAS